MLLHYLYYTLSYLFKKFTSTSICWLIYWFNSQSTNKCILNLDDSFVYFPIPQCVSSANLCLFFFQTNKNKTFLLSTTTFGLEIFLLRMARAMASIILVSCVLLFGNVPCGIYGLNGLKKIDPYRCLYGLLMNFGYLLSLRRWLNGISMEWADSSNRIGLSRLSRISKRGIQLRDGYVSSSLLLWAEKENPYPPSQQYIPFVSLVWTNWQVLLVFFSFFSQPRISDKKS